MLWLKQLLGKRTDTLPARAAQVHFTNTLSGTKEIFIPQRPGVVLMYSCGPTVYSKQHIGNLRAAVFSDTLARTLKGAGYHVRRVINITDVGHLVGDGDRGEDKMTVGAEREHTTPEKIAERYTKMYLDDLDDLNIDTKDIQFPRATEFIKEQIALAATLEEKGFAYKLPDGLYFDTQKFSGYGKLGGIDRVAQEAGARVEVVKGKHHPADFVLWRTARPADLQQWDSPWGRGNPGWHIECSAMSRALLGPEIDVHTGGEEHIGVHHNNEIAQSESATGRTFVHYWLHNAHLTMGGEKLSKSEGNAVYLSDIEKKGIHPLSLRYFFLQAHYRTPLSFSWDALFAAESALLRLWKTAHDIAQESKQTSESSEARIRFLSLVRDDLSTPQALGILWESLKSEEYSPEEKWGLIEDAEQHFGLNLLNPPVAEALHGEEIPEPVRDMLSRREAARKAKNFEEADAIRKEIENSGYHVEDALDGPVLTRHSL